jgi:RNA polymerase sigma-70 factor, ECF subfamily
MPSPMPPPGQPAKSATTSEIDRLFRRESGRVLATLIGRLGDFDLAEEALQEAFLVAIERWPRDGFPDQPGAWITTTARNKALDRIRYGERQGRRRAELEALARSDPEEPAGEEVAVSPVVDERLRLVFTCCHPALSAEARVALTLRTLGGLKTPEIAAAFLVSPATMGQRLSRAKAKIRDARIPYRVPRDADLTERLASVLNTVYLIFNEGYSASAGEALVRGDLCAEAIRLGRTLVELMPDESEAVSLLALMLLHDSRRNSRVDHEGNLVLLPDQDRSRWDRAQIEEGMRLAAKAWRMSAPGPFAVQAAIAAEHSRTIDGAAPDWEKIAALYGLLERLDPSPVIRLNRSVAVSMAGRDVEALAMADELLAAGALDGYRYLHVARGEFLSRLDRPAEATGAYLRALELSRNEVDRHFVLAKLAALEAGRSGS